MERSALPDILRNPFLRVLLFILHALALSFVTNKRKLGFQLVSFEEKLSLWNGLYVGFCQDPGILKLSK